MRLTLITPFKDYAGVQRSHLDLRDCLTGGDVLFSQRQAGSELERGYHMIARVSGLDIKDLDGMDVRDIARVDAHIALIQTPPKDATSPKAE